MRTVGFIIRNLSRSRSHERQIQRSIDIKYKEIKIHGTLAHFEIHVFCVCVCEYTKSHYIFQAVTKFCDSRTSLLLAETEWPEQSVTVLTVTQLGCLSSAYLSRENLSALIN